MTDEEKVVKIAHDEKAWDVFFTLVTVVNMDKHEAIEISYKFVKDGEEE